MRLRFLKSLFLLKFDYNDLKKYLIILNVCLFISVFALVSSGISIYYQYQINKNDVQLLEFSRIKNHLKLASFYTNNYQNFINRYLLNFRYDRNFADLVADNTVHINAPSRSRERFFISVKNFVISIDGLQRDVEDFIELSSTFEEFTKFDAISKKNVDELNDYISILDKTLKQIFEFSKEDLNFKKRNFEIFSENEKEIKNIIYNATAKEKFILEKNVFDGPGEKNSSNYYFYLNSKIDYNKYSKISEEVEGFVINYQLTLFLLQKMLLDTENFLTKGEALLKKENSQIALRSSQAILIAFILQILVFFFVNFFEISTYRNENNEKNNSK